MIPAKSILVVLFAAAAVEPCLAQLSTLTRVEQGYSDIEPIARSLRVQPVDLRESVGFDILYKGTWNDPAVGSREVFARRHGALTAVFPRSSYVRTKEGVVPEIPAGTIFYFGDVPPTLEEVTQRQEAASVRLNRVRGRLNLRQENTRPPDPVARIEGQSAHDADVRLSIWSSESYRRIRVSRLLQAAVTIEHGSASESIEPIEHPAPSPTPSPDDADP